MVHHRFARWMRLMGLTTVQLAAQLNCNRSFVSLLLTGRKRPGLTTAVKIEKLSAAWSEGPIRCSEWCSAEELEGLPARAA